MKKIFVVTGQTAAGKTEYAVELASKYDGELVNADSRQIYKHLDIVSGKDLDIIKKVPIHLYDIVDPKEHFSSHEWTALAEQTIKDIEDRGKTPIIVGGTYFYLADFLYRRATSGAEPDWTFRNKLNGKSVTELRNIFRKLSPKSFEELNNSEKNNPQRLIRRIEISKQGKEIVKKDQFKFAEFLKDYEIEFIGFRFADINDLKTALQRRVKKRIQAGAIEEVKELLKKGYSLTNPGLSSNACLEIHQYLTGEISQGELATRWVNIEMQYAKRQYTFMKRDPNIHWLQV